MRQGFPQLGHLEERRVRVTPRRVRPDMAALRPLISHNRPVRDPHLIRLAVELDIHRPHRVIRPLRLTIHQRRLVILLLVRLIHQLRLLIAPRLRLIRLRRRAIRRLVLLTGITFIYTFLYLDINTQFIVFQILFIFSFFDISTCYLAI